jgi:hypothetical protein
MELEEIHSLALSPAIAAPFAALWSEDDKISVITEKGLHVVVSNHFSFNITGFLDLSFIVYTKQHNISETNLFLSSGENFKRHLFNWVY